MPTITDAIALMEQRWTRRSDDRTMVALTPSSERRTRRHLIMNKDDGGLYVRLGKRGAVKRYLKDMAGARIFDRNLCLAVFFEYED